MFGPSRTKLKTGARPGLVKPEGPTAAPAQAPGTIRTSKTESAKYDQVYKRGSLMFIEGERGTNMFILKAGKVKILKQEGSKSIELAVLGPGSVLGELGLLIDMPRAATAQVLEDVTALSIDRPLLEAAYSKIPPWLASVIKVVVARLHDTLQKNSRNLVSGNIGGVAQLLLESAAPASDGKTARASLNTLKEEAVYGIGLSGGDTDKIVNDLILKGLILLGKGPGGETVVEISRMDLLDLFVEYQWAKFRGKSLPGAGLSPAAEALARALLASAPRGRRDKDGSLLVSRIFLEGELKRAGLSHHPDPEAADFLAAQRLLRVEEDQSCRINEAGLKKALLLKEWMAAFAEESS